MTKAGQPGVPARTRILVIDDDELALQAISDVLEAAGYDVHSMVSPIGATQVIVSQKIEAAVIDLNMPVMRGDRFITLLRSWDKLRELPTLLISGDSQRTLDEISATLSGVAVVTKRRLQHSLVPRWHASSRTGASGTRPPPRARAQTLWRVIWHGFRAMLARQRAS